MNQRSAPGKRQRAMMKCPVCNINLRRGDWKTTNYDFECPICGIDSTKKP
jgi:predicted RNA-binding Zn-ribbon protein involved in translation (DUF1610 family)